MKMPRLVWLLVIGMAVNVTGASFIWPLNTIYIHNELGKSLSMAGFVLMLNSGASVVGNLLGGKMFDRLGGYISVMSGILIALVSLVGMVIIHTWPWYPIWLILIGFGSGIVFPSIYAMAGVAWPEGGRRTFNAIYLAQNLGVAIGAALGGFMADISFNIIFIANLVLFIVFFFIALFGYREAGNIHRGRKVEEVKEIVDKSRFHALLLVCAAYCLCWVGYVQWQTTISSYTQNIGISLQQYSLLWALNGVLIVVGQPLIRPFVRLIEDKIKTQIAVGIGIFIVSFVVTSFAESFMMFVVGMVILTIGEMFVWPAVPTIANILAPEGRVGTYQGIVNSTATLGRAIGPVAGGIIVDLYDMQTMFYAMIALLLLSFVFLKVYDRNLAEE
ncbi:MDR family MFS transporter [Macrococcus carouselicus]|uniref:MFS transporter n=1 Tax=Macrococcus carouselicus TaxID=69969 RepID=A0A9Q8FRA2_9STAP|nr:MFS transporter [Macrococcus carouselicus]TDM04582.1 MFS transporter [Macrococcus carouselicus]